MPKPADEVDTIIAQWQRERADLSAEALQAMALLGRLKRCSALLTPLLEQAFAPHGLNAGEFDVLATLRRAGKPYTLSPTQLFNSLMVTSGTMTHRLKLLQERGLIERHPNPHDSRSLLVSLSPKGRKCIDQALLTHVENEQALLAAIPTQTRTQLDRALRALMQAWGEAAPLDD